MWPLACLAVLALLAYLFEARARRRDVRTGEPSELNAANVEEWIRWIDRAGEVHLVAEGPWARYGMICRVGVTRVDQSYEVSFATDSDGAGPVSTSKDVLSREALAQFLQRLCGDERPVLSSSEMAARAIARARRAR